MAMSGAGMVFDYRGCRVLVTGGSNGIGACIARAFLDAGAHVTITGTRPQPDDYESDLIAQALEQTGWNKNRAARLLGLNRTTLIEKIKKTGLKDPSS